MTYAPNDDLKRALEALDIFRVWGAAYTDGAVIEAPPAQQRDGQYKSPFRDDGKRGSFSICHKGHGFTDFGGDGGKGGVWKFAKLCWPNVENRELAKKLIELSGITPTPRPAPGTGSGNDPLAKAAKALEKKQRERALEDAVYEERKKALEVHAKKTPAAWAGCVRESYLEGVEEMRTNRKWIERLAKDRGWPLAWADALVELELVSYAWERWATPGDKWAKRQKAFAVQAPRLGRAGAPHSLVNVGYHQRFFVPAAEGKPERKGWVYVPSLPKAERVRVSPLESKIMEDLRARGVNLEECVRLVPPLPFVIGDIQAPRLIVLLEGQWDAATFFGACGWFHDTTPPNIGVAVFGIRGAEGTDAFLSYWADWLELVRPNAWVIADNDAAGGKWREAPPAQPGMPRPPSLAERLKAVGCRGVTISWLKPGAYGKDFNDYYKAATPTPEKMFNWFRNRGLMDAGGKLT